MSEYKLRSESYSTILLHPLILNTGVNSPLGNI
nr:MAG TPA: hypothetical protein [Crassvirales sp.]DAO19138.1 MAG TPA: hypothetical protein [Caudoviricetes sp.]